MHKMAHRGCVALLALCLLVIGGCRLPFRHRQSAAAPQVSPPRPRVLVGAPTLSQYPDYPTGCEAVATVMALQYVSEKITVAAFIDRYLPCSTAFHRQWGRLYGPDPYRVFVGNPRSEQSYGCMAPVIRRALTAYFGSNDRVIDTTGESLYTLCRDYVDHSLPVILWATGGMTPVKEGTRWRLENGQDFTWPSGEHCLLLVGYSSTHYFLNDPKIGKTVAYPHAAVEQRYTDMGSQSLVVTY